MFVAICNFILKNKKMISENSNISKFSLLSSIIAILLGLIYQLFRFGFESQLEDIIIIIGLSLLLICFPDIVNIYFENKPLVKRKFITIPLITLTLICFLFIGGLLFSEISFIFSYFISIIGYCSFLFLIFRNKERMNYQTKFHLILFFLFSIILADCMWGRRTLSPLFLEKVSIGDAYLDTVFHSAISNLIKTFGFPATGVDGVPYISYHWGSHWLFSCISTITNTSAFQFYNLGYPIIFVPLFIKFLLYVILRFSQLINVEFKQNLFFYVLLFFSFHFAIPKTEIIPNSSLLLSESHFMAILFTFLMLAFILDWIQIIQIKNELRYDFRFWLILAFLFACVGFFKVSIIFLICVASIYLFFRLNLYRSFYFWLYFMFLGVVALSTMLIVRENTLGNDTFELFSFYKRPVSSLIMLFIFYYLGLWINWFFIFIYQKSRKLALPPFFLIVSETILLISIVGILPGMFLKIGGGSAIYFSNLQWWLYLCISIVIIQMIKIKTSFFSKYFFLKIAIYFVCALLLLSPVAKHSIRIIKTNFSMRNMIAETNFSINKTIKLAFKKSDISFFLNDFDNFIHSSAQNLKNEPYYNLLIQLEKYEKLSANLKKEYCIFIPKENKLFWEKQQFRPVSSSFIPQAISGISMIGGMLETAIGGNYGMTKYNYEGINRNESFSDSIIKKYATEKGFRKVIVIKDSLNGFIFYEL